MTPKEALKWLFLKASKQHGQLWAIKLTKPYDDRKKLVDEITSVLDNHGGKLNDTFHSIDKVITELEELTTTVKRYFELKAKGITTLSEALEHIELLIKINEMVGIEE